MNSTQTLLLVLAIQLFFLGGLASLIWLIWPVSVGGILGLTVFYLAVSISASALVIGRNSRWGRIAMLRQPEIGALSVDRRIRGTFGAVAIVVVVAIFRVADGEPLKPSDALIFPVLAAVAGWMTYRLWRTR